MTKAFALTVRQPWASLIIWGLKGVEIRSWSTDLRGTLVIHASKTVDDAAMRRFHLQSLPTGSVLGAVSLVDVEALTSRRWGELAVDHLDLGSFTPGLYAWHLAEPRALDDPLPWRGERGLFELKLAEGVAERLCLSPG
ncbi:MAG TPA: ASCH domain-containing protein [Thermoanaerobaculia bacterium]|nr:ASCH domain-containing protein [Thermoanaerobaculia bacterium]